jgi:integrase
VSLKKPAYTLHRPTGQARVRIDGKDHYLGPFDSDESRARYDDKIADWLAKHDDPTGLTIDDLIVLYTAHARQHYRKKGEETSEVNCIAQAVRPLSRLFGGTLCRLFGPKSLRKVRDEMIKKGIVRTSINIHVGRIRRMFKWAVAEEMLPVNVYQSLCTLAGLEADRSDAKESEPVRPVSEAMIDAVQPFVSRYVWGMIQLQLMTGMRPGEVLQIRGIDINMSGRIWEYIPRSHKTAHHGILTCASRHTRSHQRNRRHSI